MKNNNFTYETPEKQDDFIQSLNVADIKANIIGESLLKGKSDVTATDEYLENDFELQNLPIRELKELSIQDKSNVSMQYKITHTGLNENTILLIETNKYNATLDELMSYCKGLNISYRKFLPELFVSEKI